MTFSLYTPKKFWINQYILSIINVKKFGNKKRRKNFFHYILLLRERVKNHLDNIVVRERWHRSNKRDVHIDVDGGASLSEDLVKPHVILRHVVLILRETLP